VEALKRLGGLTDRSKIKSMAEDTDCACDLWVLYENGVLVGTPLHAVRKRVNSGSSEEQLPCTKWNLEGQQVITDVSITKPIYLGLFDAEIKTGTYMILAR
jgi:hypothetical protein